MKILYCSDDIRLTSGYGKLGKALCKYLISKGHKVINMGGSLTDLEFHPVEYEGITIYPVHGYGNVEQLRMLLRDKPDVVLMNADPRFFDHIFSVDNEIRSICPLVFFHLWDAEPFPIFNVPKYNCCDHIIAASKFTYDLLTQKSNGSQLPKITYIPIGIDTDVFKPLDQVEKDSVIQELMKLTNNEGAAPKFIAGFVGRFAIRKRILDIMDAFTEFARGKNDVMLLLHTSLRDEAGDITYVKENLFRGSPIIISQMQGQPDIVLNKLMSSFSVNINISSAEGFGMPIVEGMAAGIPPIALKTGGPSGTVNDDVGWLLEPDATTYVANEIVPYIHEYYISKKTLVATLEDAYQNPEKLRKKSQNCRDHVVKNFNEKDMVANIEKVLVEARDNFTPYPPITITRI
jgi:glycosyltransferase involved in cell wall biosynthesis